MLRKRPRVAGRVCLNPCHLCIFTVQFMLHRQILPAGQPLSHSLVSLLSVCPACVRSLLSEISPQLRVNLLKLGYWFCLNTFSLHCALLSLLVSCGLSWGTSFSLSWPSWSFPGTLRISGIGGSSLSPSECRFLLGPD